MAEEFVICSARKRGRDLTIDTLKIANKEPVYDVIILTPSDVKTKKDGKYGFLLSYRLGNVGYMPSKDFENIAYFNDKVVSHLHGFALRPNQFKTVTDTAFLDLKDGEILVKIDAFLKITEECERNNDISAKLLFRGFNAKKSDKPQPDIKVEILRVAEKLPMYGRVTLTPKDAVSQSQGKYTFKLDYAIRNYGTAPTAKFENYIIFQGNPVHRHPHISLRPGESRIIEEKIQITPKDGSLIINADAGGVLPPSREGRKTLEVNLIFQSFGIKPVASAKKSKPKKFKTI